MSKERKYEKKIYKQLKLLESLLQHLKIEIQVNPVINIVNEPEDDVAINNGEQGTAIADAEELALANNRSNAQTDRGDQALVGSDGNAVSDPDEVAIVGKDGSAQVAGQTLTSATDDSVAAENDASVAKNDSNAATNVNNNRQGRESGPGRLNQ